MSSIFHRRAQGDGYRWAGRAVQTTLPDERLNWAAESCIFVVSGGMTGKAGAV